MITVYLAGPYGSRPTLAGYAAELREAGLAVSSSWLAEPHDINPGTTHAATALPDAQVDGHARLDVAEVLGCSVFVLFTAAAVGVEGGGGRHVETGIAIGAGKPVIVVGEPENIFHRMEQVERVADWPAAKAVLEELVS